MTCCALQDPDEGQTFPPPMVVHWFAILGFYSQDAEFIHKPSVSSLYHQWSGSSMHFRFLFSLWPSQDFLKGFFRQVTNILMDKLAWKIAVLSWDSLKGCFKTNKISLANTSFVPSEEMGVWSQRTAKEQKMFSHSIVPEGDILRWGQTDDV